MAEGGARLNTAGLDSWLAGVGCGLLLCDTAQRIVWANALAHEVCDGVAGAWAGQAVAAVLGCPLEAGGRGRLAAAEWSAAQVPTGWVVTLTPAAGDDAPGAVVERLPVMVYRSASNGAHLEWISPGASAVTGLPADVLLADGGAAFRAAIPAADRHDNWRRIAAALARRTSFSLIYRYVTPAGELRWLAESGRGRWTDGRLHSVEGLITDISELKRSEARQRQLNESLLAVLEATDELVAATELDVLCRRAVEVARERLGVERCALFLDAGDGEHLLGTFGTDSAGATTDEHGHRVRIRDFWRDGDVPRPEKRRWVIAPCPPLEWQDGQEVFFGDEAVWAVITPVHGERGLLGALVNDSAITGARLDEVRQSSLVLYASVLGGLLDHLRAEHLLRESQARYRDLFRHSLNGFALCRLLCDDTGQPVDAEILTLNPAAERLIGHSQAELHGRPVSAVLGDWGLAFARRYASVALTGEPLHVELVSEPFGRVFEINAFQPRPGHFALLFSDITDRRQSETERQLNEQRLEALVQLNDMSLGASDELAEFALEQGVALTRSQFGYLAFANEDETVLSLHSWSHAVRGECQVQVPSNLFEVASMGLWGEPVRQRRPVLTNDYGPRAEGACGLPTGHLPLRRHMGVPIIDGGRVVALAGVANKEAPYDENDARQLSLLITGLWRELQRRRAVEALARREAAEREFQQRLRALHLLTAELSGTPDLDQLCRATVLDGRTFLGVDRLSLWFVEPDQRSLRGTFAADAAGRLRDQRGSHRPLVTGQGFECLLDEGPAEVVACAPLRAAHGDGPAAGYLLAENRASGRSLDDRDRELLRLLATSVGTLAALKSAEAELRASERRYRTIFARAPLGIVHFDARGRAIDCNEQAWQIFGCTRDELLGTSLLHRPEAELQTAIAATLAGQATRYEGLAEVLDGASVRIRATLQPLPGHDEAHSGGLALFEDISAEYALEQRLRQASKMEAIGRLAGGVAHDFNNLLTAIIGYTDLTLALMAADDPLRENLEAIGGASARAGTLTGQLLAFSRRQVLQPRVFDPNQLITDLLTMLKPLVGEDVRVLTCLAPDLALVKADAGQLEQVLMNLAANARDAMAEGGSLVISTSNVSVDEAHAAQLGSPATPAWVRLSVRDSGCGMDEATLARLFEPFFSTKERGKGTGFGLSTSYGIVRQSGGQLTVESAPGAGSTFHIWLPATAEAPSGPLAATRSDTPRGRGETVLLVEDEPEVLAVVRQTLEGLGYQVKSANGGSQALALLGVLRPRPGAAPVDILLSDVVMPDLSGPDLAERLRCEYPTLKVLFMSGYTDNAKLRAALEQPETEFIQKPFSPAQLARRLRGLLDS